MGTAGFVAVLFYNIRGIFNMTGIHSLAAIAVAIGGLAALPAQATVFGSLANFDVVNDTGKDAYGFEIEIDDSSFDHTKIGSVFGLNRVFGFVAGGNPLAVVRYGSAEIVDLPGIGVKVRYGGNIASGITTPSGQYSTPGESCWPGANPGWQANPCDHFGITTLGSPAVTKYSWLVKATPGALTLTPQVDGIPAVNYVYVPPVVAAPGVVAAPAVVKAMIQAVAPNPEQPENVALWGQAFWVKTFTAKAANNIDLGDLLRGQHGNAAVDGAETETEWSIFQNAPAGVVGANEAKEHDLQLGAADKAIIRRYEFYKYTGLVDPEGGEAICNGNCEKDPFGLDPARGHLGVSFVGDFVGQQIAGFNVAQAAAVPEPQGYAMMLAGLALMGGLFARRARGRP